MNPINPSRRWRLASRRVVAGREIKPQYKSKPNTELSKPNRKHRGVYQKKKKSPIHKPKSNPVNHLPTDGHVAAVVATASSSSSSLFVWSPFITDRRSKNTDRSASAPVLDVRRSVLPPALRQGILLFFLSDSFSVSRSLIFISVFLSVFAFLQINIVDAVIGSSLCLCASAFAPVSGARCLLRQSGPPSRFLSNSLSVSLSLSH